MEVEYRRSSNLGTSWDVKSIISDIDTWWSGEPTIAAYQHDCGEEVLIAWWDMKYGWPGIFSASIISRTSLNGGKDWLPERVLTKQPGGCCSEAVIKKNVRAVSWYKEVVPAGTSHAAVNTSNNGLLNPAQEHDLTSNATLGAPPSMVVSSHAVHVVYEQYIGSTFRITYRRGEFIQKDVRFTLSTGTQMFDTTETTRSSFDTIMVSNSGSDTLAIGTAIADDLNFNITPYDTVVPPESSTQFVVSFTPTSDGLKSGKFIFYHNGQSSPECITVSGVGRYRKEEQQYQPGWNLVSLPVRPGPHQLLPSMYEFRKGYIQATSMKFGQGYWAKPDSIVVFTGSYATDETVAVRNGWNIIGSLSAPVQTNILISSPLNIVESPFYGYGEEGYFAADAILPGKGYWVKVSGDGKIILQVQDSSMKRLIDNIKSKTEKEEHKKQAPTKADIERYRTAEMMWYENLLSTNESNTILDKQKDGVTQYVVKNNKLYLTGDQGKEWNRVDDFPGEVLLVAANNRNPQTVLVAAEHTIYRKSGSLWMPVMCRSNSFLPNEMAYSKRNQNIVWLKATVTENGISRTEIWYSFDTGMTWNLARTSHTPSDAIHLQPDVYPPYWDECDTTLLRSEL